MPAAIEKDFSNSFPVLDRYTYLNTASCGPLSTELVTWRREQDHLLLEGGSAYRDLHKDQFRDFRKDIAAAFSTSPLQVALVPNFSFGFNVLVDALPQNSKVLLLKEDYPSVNWPFEFRKFDVEYAEINANLERNIEEAILKHRPDVFAFSLVQFVSGIRIDLKFLTRIKENFPELLLLADGTQFLGTVDLDFDNSPIDALGASGYKWMLGGYGNGLFLLNEDLHKKIRPRTLGYNSADIGKPKDGFHLAGHLEPGHQAVINFGSLAFSISRMKGIGMGRVETYLTGLVAEAKVAFTDLGLLQPEVVEREIHSPIFNLQTEESVFGRLKDNGILGSWRGNGIRVSFHYYNSREDLQRLLSFLR